MERNGILGAGTWVVDHIKMVDEWPAQDTLCTVLSSKPANGGLPYNVLKDLSKMNFPAPLQGCGLLGNDTDGKFIENDCKAHNIDTSLFVFSNEAATSFTDVMTVQSTGRRTFFHNPASNDLLKPEHIKLENSNAKIFLEGYFGLHKNMDSIDENGETGHSKVFKKAKELGFITAADLVSKKIDFEKATKSSLPYLDYLSLNEIELRMLVGKAAEDISNIKDESALKKCAGIVLGRGINKYMVVHFPECVYAFGQDGTIAKCVSIDFPRKLIKGAVGAGDAMYAGILFGVHQGWDIADSLKMGVCAATQCLTNAAASDGMVDWRECLKLPEIYGYEKF